MGIDRLITYPNASPVWAPALENELGCLSQGCKNRVKPQNTMEFVHRAEIPGDRKITYANFVCYYRPLKSEKLRVRIPIGGDKLDYPDATGLSMESLIKTKLLINSIISVHKNTIQNFVPFKLKIFS